MTSAAFLAAATRPPSAELVFSSPELLVIALVLYVFVLFALGRYLERRVLIAWGICLPLSWMLFTAESAFRVQNRFASPAMRALIGDLPWVVGFIPFLFMGHNRRTPEWFHGRTWILGVVSIVGFLSFTLIMTTAKKTGDLLLIATYVVVVIAAFVYASRIASPQRRRETLLSAFLLLAIGLTTLIFFPGRPYSSVLPYIVFGELGVAGSIMYWMRRGSHLRRQT